MAGNGAKPRGRDARTQSQRGRMLERCELEATRSVAEGVRQPRRGGSAGGGGTGAKRAGRPGSARPGLQARVAEAFVGRSCQRKKLQRRRRPISGRTVDRPSVEFGRSQPRTGSRESGNGQQCSSSGGGGGVTWREAVGRQISGSRIGGGGLAAFDQ